MSDQVLAVYVGQKSQGNLRVGTRAQTWGFKEAQQQYAQIEAGDFILLASGYSGGSPRAKAAEWVTGTLDAVVLGRVLSPVYHDARPLWPDEGGDVSYPHRVRFEVIDELHDVALGGGELSPEVAEGLRLSAVVQGRGYLLAAKGGLFGGRTEVARGAASPVDRLLEVRRGSLPGGGLAPHKPLLILLALARLKSGLARLAGYRIWADPLRRLLHEELGVAASGIPNEPIWRLQRDRVWEVLVDGRSMADDPRQEVPVTFLDRSAVSAGLAADVHSGLEAADIDSVALEVAEHFFPGHGADKWTRVQAALTEDPPDPAPGSGRWLFQANPKLWNLEENLANADVGDVDEFTVSRYRSEIASGDLVALWQSGPRSGIYAIAEIDGVASERQRPDWRPTGAETEWSVPIRYRMILPVPISRAQVEASPVLSLMQVMRAPQGTNFRLTDEEWAVMEEMIEQAGVVEPVEVDISGVSLADVCRDVGEQARDAHLDFGARHDELVRSAVVSLATKQFLILTGLSGSGKTRLGIAIGEWFGPDRLCVIAVRPDWTGPDALLGFENGLSDIGEDGRHTWVVPEALQFILAAARDPKNPYLLLLDEMNLAHVERYFADVLSGMESGRPVVPNLTFRAGAWRPIEPDLVFPRNLFIVGTVNVDETTYMFSPKVLDRANTIEFRVATEDLRLDARPIGEVATGSPALRGRFLAEATNHVVPSNDALASRLRGLHAVLARYDREFGHRVFLEALRFSALWGQSGDGSPDQALDLQVMQKVLPRIHGSARQIGAPLNHLAWWCLSGDVIEPGADFDPVTADADAAILPRSFGKVVRMVKRLRSDHFASFAE